MATKSRKQAPANETPVTTGPVVTLQTLIASVKAGEPYVFTSPAFHTGLVASGDVEINSEIVDDHGNIATRPTAKHLETQMTANTPAEQKAVAAAKPVFEIKYGEIPPKAPRNSTGLRAGRAPIYPFDDLEINQYFFVADKSADKPAAKALASTVAAANLRHSEAVEGETRTNRKGNVVSVMKQLRKFKVFNTTETIEGVEVKGAKVFRVALTENDTLEA